MKKLFLLIVTSLFVFSGFARDKSSLKFRLVYDGSYIDLENQSVPEGFEAIRILKGMKETTVLVEKNVQLDGTHIKNFKLAQDMFGYPNINFTLDDEGTQIFAKLTRENIRKEILLEMDGIAILSAIIREEITGGQVAISGVNNLNLIKIIKDNFECEDSLNINFDVDFVRVTAVNGIVDRKDPKAVLNAFMYYYFTDDPVWKSFVASDGKYSKSHDNITSVRDNFPETLNYSEIQIQKAEKLKKKLPFYLFKNNKDIPFSYLYKINISGYEYIAQVNMIMDKAGNFSIKGF
ncbi:MAG: hypothetical protein PUD17_02475 [Treponema sp.]|uniref:SecDF P1 head subdomain-containing protein n=1 Tax=Treponema sp. TaxID=166 RepID=UPI00298E3F8D|nr:hypothetical protein [Treponema sp.]MDD5810944.1 hypothetical protein [Treponema sp.]